MSSAWKLLKDTITSFIDDEALSRGAAIAFYTVTSIAPILLIVIAIAGLVFGHDAAQNAITGQLSGLMGKQTADVLQTAVASASGKSSGIIATIVGIVTLIVTASGVFGEMQSALNVIWKAKPKGTTVSRLIRARAASLGLVAALGFLLMVSLVVSTGLTALGDYLNSILPFGKIILTILNGVVSIALLSVLFAAIYKVLPDCEIHWRDVMIGAVVTAVLFTIGKSLISWYIGSSAVASSYGAAGALIVLLLWVYYSAQIFLVGAEFTKVYANRHGSKQGEPVAKTARDGSGSETDHDIDAPAGTNTVQGRSVVRGMGPPRSDRMANTDQDASLSDLEREAERNRAQLASTVGELHDRVTPDAVKADVKEYIHDRGQQIYRSVERSARENPMRTVAIAAGLAYPLWRIVSSIPVPILLVGAGLALAKTSSGETSAAAKKVGDLTARVRDQVGEHASALGEQVGEYADALKQRFDDTSDKVMATAHDVRDRISDTADRARSAISAGAGQLTSQANKLTAQASTMADNTAGGASDALSSARKLGSDAVASASDRLSSAYQAGADMASQTGERAMEFAGRSQERFVETIEKHPLFVGALGLAIGAVIASALPATRIENRTFGAGADELKSRAGALASQGVEAAKSAAGEVYAKAASAAGQHGLTPDAMREAAKTIGDKVSNVASHAAGDSDKPGKPGERSPA